MGCYIAKTTPLHQKIQKVRKRAQVYFTGSGSDGSPGCMSHPSLSSYQLIRTMQDHAGFLIEKQKQVL